MNWEKTQKEKNTKNAWIHYLFIIKNEYKQMITGKVTQKGIQYKGK